MPADRNLILGILAVQLDFVSRDALIAGMNACLLDKSKPLGDVLRDSGALSAEQLAMLSALVAERLRQNDNDAQKYLGKLSLLDSSLGQQMADLTAADGDGTIIQTGADSIYAPTSPLPTPMPNAGRYRIIRLHARGGLGEVYVAEDTELGRQVALKEIQARHAGDAASRLRFVLEAEITGGLEHPGIVPVYGLGTYADGRPYYAMRFIKGDNLGEAIRRFHNSVRFESLEFRQLLQRFIDVCNAVAYAHSRGVLHRDLKPGNIMLGQYGETLVVDWGLAKLTVSPQPEQGDKRRVSYDEIILRAQSGGDSSVTEVGSALGTPAYMPPEQAVGDWERLGPASDVYSLGATLYELLTGCTPFDGTVNEVLGKVQSGNVLPPRTVTPAVPRALEAVCLKAMALKPSDRYHGAQDLAKEIERWLADEPVSACTEPFYLRARRWARHHRPLVTGLATTLLVALVSTTIGMVVLGEKNQALARADQAEQVQRRRADVEKQIAEAVSDFLQNKLLGLADTKAQADALLAAGRSSGEAALDPRISVLLDRAAAELTPDKIETRFPNQPLIQAAILATIGNTYSRIGKFPAAIVHLVRARELRLAHLGADRPETLTATNDLAQAYSLSGKLSESIDLFKHVLDGQTVSLGPDHPDTLTTADNLASAYRGLGKLPEAIRLYEQVRDARMVTLGADHAETLRVLNNLAVAYCDSGRLADGIRLYEQLRVSMAAQLGADHPDVLVLLNNLAVAYKVAGNLADAIPLYERVQTAFLAKLGPDHPTTLATIHNLAAAYNAADKLPEAIRLFENVRDVSMAKLGADHPNTLVTLTNLAAAYRDSGRIPDAIALFEQVRDVQVAKLGADHPDTLMTFDGLGMAYQLSGNLAEALRLYEQAATQIEKQAFKHQRAARVVRHAFEAYERSKAFEKAESWRRKWLAHVKGKSGPDSLPYAAELAGLGGNLIQQMKYAEGESVLRDSFAIREKKEPDVWTTFHTKSLLGGALTGRKKYAEAEPFLVTGYEGIKSRAEKIPAKDKGQPLRGATQRLIELYDAWGKPEEGVKWRKELAEVMNAAAATKPPQPD